MTSALAPPLARRTFAAAALVVALVSTRASAQPADAGVDAAADPVDAGAPTGGDAVVHIPALEPTATLPRANEASGVEIPEPPTTGERLRWIPRAIFFIPRWTFWLVAQPLRLTAWTYEKTQAQLRGALFSVDQVYGIYPVANYSTDYGFSVGARFVHRNTFGRKERLRLSADWGGEFRQGYAMRISSGERFGKRVSATLGLRYQRRPGERFFGIGNEDETTLPEMPIDPQTSDDAIGSRFREDITRAVGSVDTLLVGDLKLRVTGAWAKREFGDAVVGPSIAERYDTSRLIGFANGVNNVYVEAELIYDSRRPTSRYISQVMDATGWYASVFAGRATGVGDDTTDFMRYGGEVQRLIDLYQGSRVLTLRASLDGVAGTDGRTDGKISFIDLPRLGGADFLRGYPRDRFRDKGVSLLTAEYAWDLGNYFGGYAFVDLGRAFNDFDDVAELRSYHMGFGGGIEMRTHRSFLFRAQLAASRSGDVFFELALSPAFGRRERAGRY
ncbi:MAG: hypothetical protein H0T46_34405 [Deltaproteobacteria bacterium]|nr:hypothetical protein [Deltaproteobacteria bacterium]